jgi:ketosteroid isomerase-like protein
MRNLLCAAVVLGLMATPALAEDVSATLARQNQEMYDAISDGNAKVWDKYVAQGATYVDEAGTISTRDEMIKQIVPLPKGISGKIVVETLTTQQHGDTAVTVHREHETEYYFGQTLHAEYLTTTVWRKEKDGWKVIAIQALAELKDPPTITLPAAKLADYVGTYRLKDGDLTYTVTRDGEKLSGTRSGRPTAVLNAEASDVFFVSGQPRIRKIFQRDASGKVAGLVDRREGRDVVWVKTP